MLYPDDAILEARRRLYNALTQGRMTPDKFWDKLLALDPGDPMAHVGAAKLRIEQGDFAAALALLWQGLELHPLGWPAYLLLGETYAHLGDAPALEWNLRRLAMQKLARIPEDAENFDLSSTFPQGADLDEFRALTKVQQLQVLAEVAARSAPVESPDVTTRLSTYRLLDRLHELSDHVPAELVDEIVNEGQAIVPRLVGILRGWARSILGEDDAAVVEDALALLGAIGDTSAIPALCEFLDEESPDLRGAAGWALDRIFASRPEESSSILAQAAPTFDMSVRLLIASFLVRLESPGISSVFERLAMQLDRIDKAARGEFLSILLVAMLTSPAGSAELGHRMLRLAGSALPNAARRECERSSPPLSRPRARRCPPTPLPPGPSTTSVRATPTGPAKRKNSTTRKTITRRGPSPPRNVLAVTTLAGVEVAKSTRSATLRPTNGPPPRNRRMSTRSSAASSATSSRRF